MVTEFLGMGDSTVTYDEHAPESSTTSISLSTGRLVLLDATNTLDATSALGTDVDEWQLSLTTPSGIDIELTDAVTTRLESSGGVHMFHLGRNRWCFPRKRNLEA